MSHYKPYPVYKDSGVRWLGQVPDHWGIAPLCSAYEREKSVGHETEELLSVYRDHGVIPKSSRDDNNNKASEDLSTYQLVEPGNLVANKMKTWQGSIAISKFRGIVSPAYFVYRQKHQEWSDYLHHLFRSLPYITGYMSASEGVRVNQWDLNPDLFRRFPVLLPPLDEQLSIAAHLDRETARIDALVEKKTRFIELLREKRQALITHAVTKGLDPKVKMKDSGVEWLGEVPEHWEVKPLKYVATPIIGLTYSPEDVVDEGQGTLVLRSSNIQGGKIVLNDNVYVSSPIPEQLRTRAGDIVICSRNGSRSLIGKNGLVEGDAVGQSFGAFTTVVRSKFNDYLYFVLNSSLFKFQSRRYLTTTINQLTTETLKSFELPLPPEMEMKAIVLRLKLVAARIDSVIQKTERSIELLKERRSALITAAVTGQIDLREAA